MDMKLPSTNPALPAAQLQIAFCRYYRDDTTGMSNALAQLVETYPGAPEAGDGLYWFGYLYRTSRDYATAAQVYQQLLQKFPDHGYGREAAYLAGECYALDNQPGLAKVAFIDAFKRYPTSGYSVYALVCAGDIALDAKQLDAWLKELDGLAKEKPEGAASIALARAGVLMRAGNGTGAEAACAAVKPDTLPPDVAGFAYAIKAGAANAASNFEQAATLASEAVPRCTAGGIGLDEALFQEARALFFQEKWQEADKAYAKLLTDCVIPNVRVNALALLDRAQCLYEKDEMDDIVKLSDEAVRLRPGFELCARAEVLKGNAMLKLNEYQKAAQYFKRTTVLYPKVAQYAIPAYRGLITCYGKLGLTEDEAKARDEFKGRYGNEQK
jgi:tetratricopeptide (TPR) repeat protein